MAEKTPEDQAVIDAAIAYVAKELKWRDEHSREGWALVDAVKALPNTPVTPLYG